MIDTTALRTIGQAQREGRDAQSCNVRKMGRELLIDARSGTITVWLPAMPLAHVRPSEQFTVNVAID
jgi:hypothetical protein